MSLIEGRQKRNNNTQRNNDLFEEYKTNVLMNNVTMNIKHTVDINHLLQNPKDKKLVWENILDLIKAF